MRLRELEPQLASLSRAEKAQAIQMLANGLGGTCPGIDKTPGVVGGEACIVRTRVAVWMRENYRRLGWNEAKILESYPTLRAADLVNAWAYVSAHPEEIEAAIQRNAGTCADENSPQPIE
jgi:uncharacterized protein (DUF433 family)